MSQIHEFTGSYALNALDIAEMTEFEAHLATCETCRSEVDEFCAIAAELSLLNSTTPPAALRGSILDAIASTAQLSPPDVRASTAAPVSTNGHRSAEQSRRVARTDGPRRAMPEAEVPEGPEPLGDELALRRQRRRTRFLSGLVAAMVALAVGLGGVVYSLLQERQASVAQLALEEQLYEAPDARTATFDLNGGGQVTFIASKQLNRALFLGTNLPDPGTNRFQLWTGTGRPAAPVGIARDNQIADIETGLKVFFSGDIAGSDFVAVNLEPAGSTPDTPTNTPLAAAEI